VQGEGHERCSDTLRLQDEVTELDIAATVSSWTKIPIQKLQASERERLLMLEDELSQEVVGQPDAVKAIAEAVLRSRAGLSNPNRCACVYMFERTYMREKCFQGFGSVLRKCVPCMMTFAKKVPARKPCQVSQPTCCFFFMTCI
jgi:hypothetical protein